MMITIEIHQGDITKQQVDVIVNAANQKLLDGAGVDGAIHRAGGLKIMAECDQIRQRQGGCPTGQAVITTAGDLQAKHVIHAVGPIWNGGNDNEAQLLKACYLNSLNLAAEHGLNTIAFPNISTGVYGYPKELAAQIAVTTTKNYAANSVSSLEQIIFVCFDDDNYSIYKQLI